MQAYFAHSCINLLDVNIRADRDKMITDAYGLHKYNGVLNQESVQKTMIMSLDMNIQPADRKTAAIDTGILLTAIQKGGRILTEAVANLIPVLGEEYSSIPTTPAINNAVVNQLVEQAKEMYQGEFVMVGQPTMKPRDLVILNDHRTKLKGPVFVKEVIHRMNSNTGLITIVRPDAVFVPHGNVAGAQLISSLTTGVLSKLTGFMIYRIGLASTWGLVKGNIAYRSGQKTLLNSSKFQAIIERYETQKLEAVENVKNSLEETVKDIFKAKRIKLETDPDISFRISSRRVTSLNLEETRTLTELQGLKSYAELQQFINKYNLPKLDFKAFGVKSETVSKLLIADAKIQLKLDQDIADINAGRLSVPGVSRTDLIKAANRSAAKARARLANNKEFNELLNVEAKNAQLNELNTKISQLAQLSDKLNKDLNIDPLRSSLTDFGIDASKGVTREQILEAVEKQTASLTSARDVVLTEIPSDAKDIDAAVNYLMNLDQFHIVSKTNTVQSIWNDTFGPYAKAVSAAVDTHSGPIKLTDTQNILSAEAEARAAFADTETVAHLPGMKVFNPMQAFYTVQNVKQYINKTKETINTTRAAIDTAAEGQKAAAAYSIAREAAVAKVSKLLVAGKDIYNGSRLLGYLGPQAVLSLAKDTVQFVAFGALIDTVNCKLKAWQVAKLYPLMGGDVPYVAGIRGHQGLVVGDDPGWQEQLVMGWLQPTDSNFKKASNLIEFAAAAMGVEVPEYGNSPADAKWIQWMQQQDLNE